MPVNPYTPGAGFIPEYLAGRETYIKDAEDILSCVKAQIPQRSVAYYGLRGVGKTVLLNTIEKTADNIGILFQHIEVPETRDFTRRLVGIIAKFLHSISLRAAAKDKVKKALMALKAFSLTYNVDDHSFRFAPDIEPGFATGIYEDDLTELFVSLGNAASASGDGIAFFIDEIQYLDEADLGALLAALHRCNQLRYPIVIFCAGLPKILKTLGEAKSYAERLFQFERIDALCYESAEAAIVEPAQRFHVTYEEDAVRYLFDATDGYPYFIQQYCNTLWKTLEEIGDGATITKDMVRVAEPDFLRSLDAGFFSVRYNRTTGLEKEFMSAMARCETLPCEISGVAAIIGRTVGSISPCRAQLINKGLIYATGHAKIDFTVPKFDEFLRRQEAS